MGGPAFALSRFDCIQFFETFTFSIQEGPVLNSYCDIDGGYLVVNCSNAPITRVQLLDVSGRNVGAPVTSTNTNSARVPIAMLPPGIYLATVSTGRGVANTRFIAGR